MSGTSYSDIGGPFRVCLVVAPYGRSVRACTAPGSAEQSLEQVDAAELIARRGRPLRAAETDVQRLPLRAHARGRRRRHPRVDGEQPVLLPRDVGVEVDARARRATRSSARRSARSSARADLGRDRVAQARTRRRAARASDRSSPSRGSRCGRRSAVSTKRLPRCGIAVHERARTRVPQRARCRRCGRGRCRRGGGTPSGSWSPSVVDRHLHERRAAARRRPCPSARATRGRRRRRSGATPRTARAARPAARRCRGRAHAMSSSLRVREAAPDGDEVFEHHHVAVVAVGVGEPDTPGSRTGISGARSR